MADVRLSRRASDDIFNILSHTAILFGEGQATEYALLIERAVSKVGMFPRLGRVYELSGERSVRRVPVGSHVMIYEYRDGGIVILRLLHEATDFSADLY